MWCFFDMSKQCSNKRSEECQENVPLIITPSPPTWTSDTRKDASSLSRCWHQFLTPPFNCDSRNWDSSFRYYLFFCKPQRWQCGKLGPAHQVPNSLKLPVFPILLLGLRFSWSSWPCLNAQMHWVAIWLADLSRKEEGRGKTSYSYCNPVAQPSVMRHRGLFYWKTLMTFYGYKRSFIVGEFHVVCCGVLITETVCYRGKETLHSNLAHVNLISNKWRFQAYFSETVVKKLT